MAYHFDRGVIDGVDVSGLTLASVAFIPGNILQGHIRAVWFIDERATDEQADAIVRAFKGELGGPLADMAELNDELIAIERAPILFDVREGKGTLRIGSGSDAVVEAVLDSYRSAGGQPTKLIDSAFSTIPGSPAYVGRAETFRSRGARYGLKDLELEGHNAIQGSFRFVA
jgi:hypothetical protein